MRNYRNGIWDTYTPDPTYHQRSYTLLRIGPAVALIGFGPVLDTGQVSGPLPRGFLEAYADACEEHIERTAT